MVHMDEEAPEHQDDCTIDRDAYRAICRELTKLCPRLVPKPLWGISIAKISSIAPQAALAISDDYPDLVRSINKYWTGLERRGNCGVCGAPGQDVDEDWIYCIVNGIDRSIQEDPQGKEISVEGDTYMGIAYLKGIRLLCKSCHLSKHLGYASVTGRAVEALQHLARINNLDPSRTRLLARQAFKTHRLLSRIEEWRIKIGGIEELQEGLVRRLEGMMNTMYRRGLYIHAEYLHYQNRHAEHLWRVFSRAISETISTLLEASERSGTIDIQSGEWIESLLEVMRDRLTRHGIDLLEREFKLFILHLLKEPIARTIETILHNQSSPRGENHVEYMKLNIDIGSLSGKWIVFTPVEQYPRIFRTLLDTLEETGLAFSAKIVSNKRDYKTKKELPIIVYSPSSIAPEYIAEAARVIKDTLERHNIYKKMFYKPDIFTVKGIYSGRKDFKPYIYTY